MATFSFVGSTTGSDNSIELHASAAAGDFCIIFNYVKGTSSKVVPTDFTDVLSDYVDTTFDYRAQISCKVLTGSESGLTGMSGSLSQTWTALIFRPSVPIQTVTPTFNGEATTGNPALQTISLSALTDPPFLAFVHAAATNAISATPSVAMTEVTTDDGTSNRLWYSIFNATTGSNITYDMADHGTNVEETGRVRFTFLSVQDLTPAKHTNTSTFSAPKVGHGLRPAAFTASNTFPAATVGRGAVGLTASLFTNSQSIPSPSVDFSFLVGLALSGDMQSGDDVLVYSGDEAGDNEAARALGQLLESSLFTNTSSFHAPEVATTAQVLEASLFANDPTFYTQVAGSTYPLTASLFANDPTFYTQVVAVGSVDLAPALFTNDQTFTAATVGRGSVNLAPALVTNTSAFHTATVGRGTITLNPPLLTNANSFPAATVSSTIGIAPSLFSDGNTFHSPSISEVYTVAPALHLNSQTFPAATVGRGAVNLAPALVTNAQSFGVPSVTVGSFDLSAALFVDGDTFGTAAVSATYALIATRLVNAQSFHVPSVNHGLRAALFDNAQSFNTHVIAVGVVSLAPPLLANAQSFHSATIGVGAVNLGPTLFTNSPAFYTATVGRGSVNLAPSLLANAQTFHTAAISEVYTVTPPLFANASSFGVLVVGRGSVNLTPALFANGQTFNSHAVASGASPLTPALFANSQTFHALVVTAQAVNLDPPLFVNTHTFHTATISTTVDLAPTLFVNTQTFQAATISEVYTVAPGLFSNLQTFHTATVGRGAVNLAPVLLTNSQSFGVPSVTVGSFDLVASLFTDADTFHAASISTTVALTVSLFTNAHTFHAPSAAYVVTPDLFANDQTFQTQVLTVGSVTIAPPLLANSSSFGAATIGTGTANLGPTLFVNEQTFHAPTVGRGSVDLAPSAVVNSQTFHTPAITELYTISPDLFANDQTLHAATVGRGSVNLDPSLFANEQSFGIPSVTVGAFDLVAALFVDGDTFHAASISKTYSITVPLFVNEQSFAVPSINYIVAPDLFANDQTFQTQVLSAGAVSLAPPLLANDQTFPDHSVTSGEADLRPPLYVDGDTFHTPTLTLYLLPERLVNSNSFVVPTVAPGAADLAPSLFADDDTFYDASLESGTPVLLPPLFANAHTFPTATVGRGSVNLAPIPYQNTSLFWQGSLAEVYGLTPPLYSNEQSFYSPAVASNAIVAPSLFDDDDTFYSATVVPGAVVLTQDHLVGPGPWLSFLSTTTLGGTPTYDIGNQEWTLNSTGEAIRFNFNLPDFVDGEQFDIEFELVSLSGSYLSVDFNDQAPTFVPDGSSGIITLRSFREAGYTSTYRFVDLVVPAGTVAVFKAPRIRQAHATLGPDLWDGGTATGTAGYATQDADGTWNVIRDVSGSGSVRGPLLSTGKRYLVEYDAYPTGPYTGHITDFRTNGTAGGFTFNLAAFGEWRVAQVVAPAINATVAITLPNVNHSVSFRNVRIHELTTDFQGPIAPTVTVGAVDLAPSLLTNISDIKVPDVAYWLYASLHSNVSAVHEPTISVGAIDLAVPLLANDQSYYAHALTGEGVIVVFDVLVDADTFHAATVATGPVGIAVPRLVNTQTFPSSTVLSINTITPDLYVDPDSFASVSVKPIIAPPLFANDQSFYSAEVAFPTQALVAALFVNTQIINVPDVSFIQAIDVPLFIDGDTFPTLYVNLGDLSIDPDRVAYVAAESRVATVEATLSRVVAVSAVDASVVAGLADRTVRAPAESRVVTVAALPSRIAIPAADDRIAEAP